MNDLGKVSEETKGPNGGNLDQPTSNGSFGQ